MWLRQLNKAVDCHFFIPASQLFWDPNNVESMTIACVSPFLPFQQLKDVPNFPPMGRQLCKMLKKKELNHGRGLRKIILICKEVPTMSPDVLQKILYIDRRKHFPRCHLSNPCTQVGRRWREWSKLEREKLKKFRLSQRK